MILLSSAVGKLIVTKRTVNNRCGVTRDGNSNRGNKIDYVRKAIMAGSIVINKKYYQWPIILIFNAPNRKTISHQDVIS